MILKDLIAEVNGLIDHNPNINTHTNSIVRIINRHYEEIASESPWRFLSKRTQQTLYADIAGSVDVTITSGSKIVTSSAYTFGTHMEGMTFKGPDDVEHLISNVDTSASPNALILDSPYDGTTATSSSWSIIFNIVRFPTDMVDFLGITIRDEFTSGTKDTRLTYVDPRREEQFILDRTVSGDPIIVLEDQADMLSLKELELTVNLASSGTLSSGSTYEYCITLESEGMESPPSAVVSVTTTTGGQSARLFWENPPGTFDIRARKIIYRRDATRNTGFFKIGEIPPNSSTLTMGWPTSDQTFEDTGFQAQDDVPLFEQLPREWLSVYRRPDSDITCEIRYHVRPHRLIGDTAAPQFPPQYHMILVYKTVAELYRQYGQASVGELYEKMAVERILQMKKKYLDRADRIYRRQQFNDMSRGFGYSYGVPSKT
tara:strand:+ start:7439 stop:8728 length:1290 start_codon:yes stop_codon:yes gene_type:complete